MTTDQIKLTGVDLLQYLELLDTEDPTNPSIYQDAFGELERVTIEGIQTANLEVANPSDTNFGILRHGIKWKGYKQNEFDRLSAEGSKLDGFLTPAKEWLVIASQTYLNAVGQVLPSIQTLAIMYSQAPISHEKWSSIHEAVKQINNIGEPEALIPYMATNLLRKAI